MRQGKDDHELAEALYERLILASVHAGSTLKKFPPAPYSPTIARLRNIHRLLKLAVTQFKTTRDMSENISRTKAKLGNMGYPLPDTVELCKTMLVKVTRQLKAAIQEELDTKHLQRQHQETLIQEHEAKGNHKVAKKIRGMRRTEQVKRLFQKCRAARHMGNEGGLTHVLVPTIPKDNPRTCENWTRLNCPKEIAKVLLDRNRVHFGQSKQCTLTLSSFGLHHGFHCNVHTS